MYPIAAWLFKHNYAWSWFFFRYLKIALHRIDPGIHTFLHQNIKFYRYLDPAKQYKFYLRCHAFQRSIDFIPRNGFIIKPEYRYLVAAAYIKLTFGRAYQPLTEFNKILIYPESYFSRITRKRHKGEVNRAGIIVLSWQDFKDGWLEEQDNLNLGLHEFSHALVIEAEMNKMHESFHIAFTNWSTLVRKTQIREQYLNSSYFREYAKANHVELFAVMTECFFETPEKFNELFPGMYKHMCHIYALNPLSLYTTK